VTSSHPFWEINKKILRYCLWNVQQMGMAGHPRHSQRVELLLHIIYDNLDSVAGPDLRLQIWDSRAVLATSSVRGEPVSQSVSPSVSQVILEPLALRMRMRTSHQNLGHCVWPPQTGFVGFVGLDSTGSSGSQTPAAFTCCQIASTGLTAPD